MKRIFNRYVLITVFGCCSLAQLQGQSLLFRVPYLPWESPQFNPAFSGSDGVARFQSLSVRTALPNNFVQSFSIDGQVKRKSRKAKDGGNIYPRIFPTGGISLLNYREKLIGRNSDYSFRELRANIGIRVTLPNFRERSKARPTKENWFSASKRTSNIFAAFNLEYTNIGLDFLGNSPVFNSSILFNENTNTFNISNNEALQSESDGGFALGALFFWTLRGPAHDKPDSKPLTYLQAGVKVPWQSIRTAAVDYQKLKVLHIDLHSSFNIDKLTKKVKSLSATLSYIHLDQNESTFPRFGTVLSQDRGVIIIHYFFERLIGLDFGTEFSRGQFSFILGGKMEFNGGVLSLYGTIGGVSDRFRDSRVPGDNRPNGSVGISYEFHGKPKSN